MVTRHSVIQSVLAILFLILSAAGSEWAVSTLNKPEVPLPACLRLASRILERIRSLSTGVHGTRPRDYLASRYNDSENYCISSRLMSQEDPILKGVVAGRDKVALRLQTFSTTNGEIEKCRPKPLDIKTRSLGILVTVDLQYEEPDGSFSKCQIQDSFF